MIYPKMPDGTIDWCVMCKHEGSDFYDLCCECEYPENSDDPPAKYEPKPMTNGDRIRRLTDEELAFLTGEPPHEGRYLCLVDMNTAKLHEQRCEWKDGQWLAYGQPIHELFSVKAWWPLPPEMLWMPHHEPEEEGE